MPGKEKEQKGRKVRIEGFADNFVTCLMLYMEDCFGMRVTSAPSGTLK
jgi:hypothetical protein